MKFAYVSGSRPLEGYTIKRGIGVGGFGEVYFAVSDAGKEVALKRIQRNLDVEIRGVSQCLNLKHPNLISLHDIRYDDEGQAWVIMECVTGESLKDVIDQNPNGLPRSEALRWFQGIVAGVAYLHDHGIVHRDLKPGNIFSDQGIVKIGDYGLSKYISCSRRSGQTESVGTFHYMAPEIGKGIYGKEIDVYALGIILFELLTGRVPFDGESSQEIIMKHLTAEPDLTSVPAPYATVIRRALLKDPAKRFASVTEMLACIDSTAVSANAGIADRVAMPPVVSTGGSSAAEAAYIADRLEADGMYFGPVRDVVSAEVVTVTDPKLVSSDSAPPEPIAQAVGRGVTNVRQWWRTANLSNPVKVVILVAAIFLLVSNHGWLVPLAMSLGISYLVYYGIRSLVVSNRSPAAVKSPSPPATTVAAVAAVATPRPAARAPTAPTAAQRRRWRENAREALRGRSYGERMGELSGSLLMAAVASTVLCLIMMIVANKPFDTSIYTWTFYAWLTLTSVAGSWLVLTLSKFWEGREGEQFHRRFIMLIAGLLLGLMAFEFSNFLNVRVTNDLAVPGFPGRTVSTNMYEPDGSLRLPAFLVYFALLFAIVRWWGQADPLRATRLSLWATGACVLWAWIWDMLWPFPQPWGFILAATVSLTVQLSAPWIGPKDRAKIRQQTHQA